MSTLTTGTVGSVQEAFQCIRAKHPDADDRTVRVVEADATREGPRLAASMLVSSQGIGAIVSTEVEPAAAGSKRAAPVAVVHYAFYS